MTEIGLGVLIFTGIVMILVVMILVSRSWLIPAGEITLNINDDKAKTLTVEPGGKLLGVLGAHDIFIPSACGGGGTCGQCRVENHRGRRRHPANGNRPRQQAGRESGLPALLPGQRQAGHGS